MTKIAMDFIEEIRFLDLEKTNFKLFIKIRDDKGKGNIKESIKTVYSFDVNYDENECLLTISLNDDETLEISDEVRKDLEQIDLDLPLYACYEINLTDGLAKLNLPITEFSKDLEKNHFFLVCGPIDKELKEIFVNVSPPLI